MKLNLLPFFTAIEFLLVSALSASPPPAFAQPTCPTVGRVLSKGDSKLPAGRLICVGETVQLKRLTTVTVLCFDSGLIHQFTPGQVVSQTAGCSSPPRQSQNLRRCGSQEIYLCLRPKGVEAQTAALHLDKPYGRVVSMTTPALRWHPAPNARLYLVQVEGKGVNWQQTTADPSLAYPSTQPPLQRGQAYKITVSAYNQRKAVLDATQMVLNVLSQATTESIDSSVAQIKVLALDPDEMAILDLVSIYLSHSLLNDAIAVLQARAQAGSANPELYRVLGDCYFSAGVPDLAKAHYEKAIALAQAGSRSDELVKAQKSLSELSLSDQ